MCVMLSLWLTADSIDRTLINEIIVSNLRCTHSVYLSLILTFAMKRANMGNFSQHCVYLAVFALCYSVFGRCHGRNEREAICSPELFLRDLTHLLINAQRHACRRSARQQAGISNSD